MCVCADPNLDQGASLRWSSALAFEEVFARSKERRVTRKEHFS